MNRAQVNGDGKCEAAEKTLVTAAPAYQSARMAARAPHSISAIYSDLQQTNVFVDLILKRNRSTKFAVNSQQLNRSSEMRTNKQI